MSTIADNHNFSSSHQWTSAIHVKSFSLLDADVQEPPSVIKPTKANKDLTLSAWNITNSIPSLLRKSPRNN
jgi:hypothetical protein